MKRVSVVLGLVALVGILILACGDQSTFNGLNQARTDIRPSAVYQEDAGHYIWLDSSGNVLAVTSEEEGFEAFVLDESGNFNDEPIALPEALAAEIKKDMVEAGSCSEGKPCVSGAELSGGQAETIQEQAVARAAASGKVRIMSRTTVARSGGNRYEMEAYIEDGHRIDGCPRISGVRHMNILCYKNGSLTNDIHIAKVQDARGRKCEIVVYDSKVKGYNPWTSCVTYSYCDLGSKLGKAISGTVTVLLASRVAQVIADNLSRLAPALI